MRLPHPTHTPREPTTSLSPGAETTTAWASAGKFPAGVLPGGRPARRSRLVRGVDAAAQELVAAATVAANKG
ncbi:hypothetical protein P7K49_036415, partial [Saguinus oedipus]